MRGIVQDDTGKKVVLFRWYQRRDTVLSDEGDRGWDTSASRPVRRVLAILLFSHSGLFFWFAMSGQKSRSWLLGLSSVVVFVGMIVFYFVLRNKDRARDTGRACLISGWCPGCGYSVTDLAPDERGLIVCPECEAAWKLS